MTKVILIFGAIFLLVILVWIFRVKSSKQSTEVISEKFQISQTDNQGGIEVTAKPKPIAVGQNAAFEISFTTHTEDLNFDLVKIATLDVDEKKLSALDWNGGTGGHHLTGTLKFPKIERQPQKIILEIKNIGGFDRQFTWNN